MKYLLTKLTKGFYEQDLNDQNKTLVESLYKDGILKKEGGIYKLNSKYRFGIISLSDKKEGAYLHVIGESVKDIYINHENLADAKENDIVVVQRFLTKRPPEGKVIKILGREKTYSVAIVLKKDGEKKLLDLKTLHPSGVELTQDEIESFDENSVFKIDNHSNSIIEYLGNFNDPKVDEKIVLAWFNKHDEFEDDVLKEAENFGKNVDERLYKNRVDLRELNFCTIDPVTAKDFDDAIYYDEKNNTLYVAIADVSTYVKPFGAIDFEAIYRGFSIYLPHRSIPMLPRILSENLCSLEPNKDRLAYVFEMKLGKDLEVASSKVYEAVIHSKRRFNYDEVDLLFDGKLKAKTTTEAEIFLMLKQLKKVTDRLRVNRLKKGFDFRSDEIRLELDEDTNLVATSVESETPSHSLIEDCMLLANKEASKRYETGVFRVHEEPSNQKLQNLYQELAAIGLNFEIKDSTKETIEEIQKAAKEMGIGEDVDTLIIQAQMQARYAPVNLGHFGLGFERYTHFTSPIRRYSDLIVHRLLKSIARGDKKEESYVLRNIEALCLMISQKEREADSVESEYARRKFARWAEKNKGKTFVAKINQTLPELTAKLDDEIKGAVIHITSAVNVPLFSKVKVVIDDVNLYNAKIYGRVDSEKV